MLFEKRKDTLIVRLHGEIDHHSSEDIRNKADREFENSKAKNMIIDFSDVDFLDSSGIGLIIGRYKNVTANGGNISIVGVSKTLDRILEISGVYKLMKQFLSLDDALNYMNQL